MPAPFTTPVAASVPFDGTEETNGAPVAPVFTSENVRDAIIEARETAPGASARYALPLIHNGTLANGDWIGYSELVPGDSTPIILPRDCFFTEFTFSNNKSAADYTLIFRKNSTGATPFYSVSKTNTQFFLDLNPNESFLSGDRIFIQYQDDGANARDAALILFFRNV